MSRRKVLCVLSWLLVAAVFLPQSVPAQARPGATDAERLHKLFDDDWKWAMETFPESATFTGYPGQNHRWTDLSPQAIERRKQRPAQSLQILDSVDRSKLSPADQLNYDLYRRFMTEQLDGNRFPSEYLQVTQLGGPQVDLAKVIAVMPAFTVQDYQNILARLNGIPAYVDQTIALLNAGLERKLTPPRVTLRDIPQQVVNHIVNDPTASPFFQPFQNMPASIPADERQRLTEQARAAIAGNVVPAFRKFGDYLRNSYLPGTRESIAFSALPDGPAWYAYQARVETTTNLTPQRIHALGQAEVRRIRAEMEKVMAEPGFRGTFADFRKFLLEDSQFTFTDAAAVMTAYRDIAKRADPETVKLFGTVPRLPYGVIPVPEYAAESAPVAYYEPGTLEAGRPGNFFVNTYDLKGHRKWQMEALVLHEAVPGHHLQTAIAQELGKVPEFRKQLGNTAYVEGWGLYAESLGYEMGFYKDPYAKFGQLNYDAWRALRLVLDTGIHSLGWTREQAIEFFRNNVVMSEHEIVVEVDRYIVWAGQALGYKIGQLKIKEMREHAARELGPAFSLRAFHDQVLGSGSLPLDILEARLKSWAADQKGKRAAN